MSVETTVAALSPLEIALRYIEGGLNVTPVLSPRAGKEGAGKAAYVVGWQNKNLNAEGFRAHYRKGSNIGVITGRSSGLVCVDLDGREGVAWYYEHEGQLGHHIVERRGTGGIHLYFRYPDGHDGDLPSRIKLFPGVDFLADGGKQVVTWPSTHRSGDAYLIDNGLTLLDVRHECDPPPAWLVEHLFQEARRPPSASQETCSEVAYGTEDDPTEVDRCRAHLTAFPPAIEHQGGDERTLAAARLGWDYNLSPDMTFRLLKEAYNPRCSPPWDDDGLRQKISNARKYARKPRGNRTLAAEFAEPAGDPPEPEPHEAPEAKYTLKYPVVSAQTYLARKPNQTLCSLGQLYVYDPALTCWRMIKDEQFGSVVMADIERADAATHKALTMTQLASAVKAVKHVLEGDAPDRPLSRDTWLDGREGEFVSCRNGILDVETGEVLPHSPSWFSFTTLPFDYDRDAECPVFERFLDSIWDNDEELKESLRLWVGYVLIRSMREQKFAVFKGASRAGKGTLVRVIEALVGERNFAACSMNTFGGDFGMEPLLDKRLAIFNDAERGSGKEGYLATERIKSITGNDSLPINRKNTSILTTQLPVKIMLVCNAMPPFVNDENAMTNRMLAFPFDKSFVGQEDPDLGKKLAAELPGILNWALRGARRLLAGERLKQSAAGAAMVEEIAVNLDSVRCFVRDSVRFTNDLGMVVSNGDLWSAYANWCRETNSRQKSRQQFFNSLAIALRGKTARARGMERGYRGVILDVNQEFSDLSVDENEL